MSEEKKEFAIKDRRIFADENKKSPSEDSDSSKKQEPEIQMPEVNFATFIISLNASALVNLGVIADPATGKEVKKPGCRKTDNRYFEHDGGKNKGKSDSGRRKHAQKHTLWLKNNIC